MPNTDAISEFLDKLGASLADGSFVRLALPGEPKILARLVELKGAPHLSVTFRHATNDVTKNFPAAEAVGWVKQQLADKRGGARLGTTARDWQLVVPARGKPRLIAHAPETTAAPARAHDLAKATLLGDSARDWLDGLGVSRPAMADKRRQIERYLEILSHLISECGWENPSRLKTAPTEPGSGTDGSSVSPIPSGAVETPRPTGIVGGVGCPSPPRHANDTTIFTLADMGCGKGYLTFGAWHLLRRVHGWPVRVIGVEARPELVATTNALAKRIGADGLEFVAGTIETAMLPRLDALIALHACDTATDDAIRRGVACGAKLIVVAPCCHKEVRPQLAKPEPLAPALAHGIMAERMAEWTTDGLRALYLEWAGYRAKLFEFVDSEHTPKNLMLAAVRVGEAFADDAARERIAKFREFFGIKQHALDTLGERGN
jgi:hypothetical protein